MTIDELIERLEDYRDAGSAAAFRFLMFAGGEFAIVFVSHVQISLRLKIRLSLHLHHNRTSSAPRNEQTCARNNNKLTGPGAPSRARSQTTPPA